MLVAFLWTAIALAAATGTAAAQTGSVQGRVTQAETDEVLPGANIILRGTDFGTVAGPRGAFLIPRVPAGSYTLVASFIGYESQSLPVQVTPGGTTRVEITFVETQVQLQGVEVVGRRATTYDAAHSFAATKTAAKIVDVPQSISVVTKEVMEDQQIYTLNEVTRNVSGVNTFSGYNDLTARGFRNQNVRLVNGLKTEFGFWSSPVLPHVERVEFIKGPASALFAAANPGGTVNMVTKKPLATERIALGVTSGSFGTYRATADLTGPLDEERSVLYRLNLSYENTDSFRFLQGHTSYVVAPSVTFLPGERTRVNAELVYAHKDGTLDRGQAIFFGNTDLTSTPISFALSQPGDFQRLTDFHLTLSLEHAFSEAVTYNASYLKYRHDEDLSEHRTSNRFLPDDPSVLQLAYIRRQQDRLVDNATNYLVVEGRTGRVAHQALAGLDVYRQDDNRAQWGARGDEHLVLGADDLRPGGGVADIDLENPVYSLNRDPETYTANWFSQPRSEEPARTTSYGLYLQDRMQLDRLQVLLGLRHEWHRTRVPAVDGGDELENVQQTALLPRLGVVYALTDRVNGYATFTQGFEPQSAGIIQQPELYGGPFDPETSDLYEAGVKGNFLGGRLLATTALYQITKRNVLVNANDSANPERLEQRGEVRSRGFEVDLAGSLTPDLQITANYALNRAEITASDDPAEVGLINENAPLHQGGFWARYTLRHGALAGVGLGAGARFVSERETFERSLQMPGYTVLDASLSYTVDRFRITARVDNLTDETHWVGGYNFGRIFPGPPRAFYIKVGNQL